jgi:hypothetical protein
VRVQSAPAAESGPIYAVQSGLAVSVLASDAAPGTSGIGLMEAERIRLRHIC